MDWFKRKNNSASPATPPSSSSPPPPSVAGADASPAGAPSEPTAEQKLQQFEQEMKETISEYVRKLESLALIVFEKSEENEGLMEKLRVQEEDMKVLLDRILAQEKDLETYKENQTEYKRRLEVLTDCLEDLARENMKLAARGAPASMPEDYEEERMPTRQEVQIQKTKSEVAAETAARSVPTKSGSRSLQPTNPPPLNVVPTRPTNDSPASAPKTLPLTSSAPASTNTSPSKTSQSPSPADSVVLVHNESKDIEDKPNKESSQRRPSSSPAGGLVMPSKSKSKPDIREPGSAPSKSPSSQNAKSGSSAESNVSSSTSTSKHKRAPSADADFSSMSTDPEALMVVLKKYKSQADSLRRELIRERQKSESLQLSVDKYEVKMVSNDKSYRDNLLKEAKRRKDAEYIANVLKKRVTELQFLLDEKDDSDHDSDSEEEEAKKGSENKEEEEDE
jgi:hypothetical protein